MKTRAALLIIAGVVLAAGAFMVAFGSQTCSIRQAKKSAPTPELAWIQASFNLTDAQFAEICALHLSYIPQCEEMCRKIDEANAGLLESLKSSSGITPEIQEQLARAAELRRHCHEMMLRYFYEVAAAMPPEEGERYLARMAALTLLPERARQH